MSYNLTNLTLRELRCLRKSLDCIPIKGNDAIFVANLQGKLDIKISYHIVRSMIEHRFFLFFY